MGCKIEFSILDGNGAQKSSPIHSVFTHRNRVRWTRFLCIKNESIRLGLYVQKPSLIDFLHRNQVLDLVSIFFCHT